MKCKIPEISWHNRDPVLSVDIQPGGESNMYRLASGGTDAHVLIWHLNIKQDGSDMELELAADLSRHQRAVNTVKWSPNGELLASGDDESVIFIWKQKGESDILNIVESTNDQDKEVWITLKVLRGHMEDIYDLSWSPNSQFLVSGSVDNSAIIWDVQKGKSQAILKDHKGFVQGVAWDPKNQYIATLSTDRYLRIFDIQSKRVVHRVNKGFLPVPVDHELHGRQMRLFHDDTLQTFFRRLCFTPDGKLLITPAGVTDYDGVTSPTNITYIFSRFSLKQPAIALPCRDQNTIAVRCCPLLLRLRPHNPEKNPPVVPLPYRMIFAVATRSSVYFYDTQQVQPFAIISNIHYTRLTDVTWSSDGRIVVVSSTDGFCSLITFEEGELGEEYAEAKNVLGSALISEANVLLTKKSKKHKENDGLTSKSRKPSTEEKLTKNNAGAVREPFLEKVLENVQQTAEEHNANGATTQTPMETDSGNLELPCGGLPQKTLSAEIIIDKEILSSDEKFISPEKKTRPVTPIGIRRHPRTPSSAPLSYAGIITALSTPTDSNVNSDCSPRSSLKETHSPGQSKRATPIATRRTPRMLIAPAPLETPTIDEEAMDAWPLGVRPLEIPKSEEPAIKAPPILETDLTTDRTEDMRLVYEDTAEATALDNAAADKGAPSPTQATSDLEKVQPPNPATPIDPVKQTKSSPGKKTPRRVQLTTISTPKSKKKLLE